MIKASLFGLALACSLCAAGEATLRIELRDLAGKPVAARVSLTAAGGAPVAIQPSNGQVAVHPRFPEMGVVARDVCVLHVPQGEYTVHVERGGEYRRVSLKVRAIEGRAAIQQVRLARWIDMAAKGWWSGDTHVHRAPADLPLLMAAADLHLAPALTRWNTRSTADAWTSPGFVSAGSQASYSVNNAEDERPWGAALFFNLKEPPALYASDAHFPSPARTWVDARAAGAFIELEKPIWWASPVMAALSPPDAIGVVHNHFHEAGVMDNEAWGRPRNRTTYEGPEGLARYAVSLYAQYVNAGFRVAAAAGSANGVLRNPIGFNRSYVYLGKDFDAGAWMAGQKAGRNFVTNGPMLFLTVEDRRPGEVIPYRKGEFLVRLEAQTAGALSRVELVVNGAAVNTFIPMASAERTRMVKMARVRVGAGGWIAARCFEVDGAIVRLAHTSPVYVGATPRRSPAALAMMREWIDEYVARLRELPASSEREEWIGLCLRARDWYQMNGQSGLPLRPEQLSRPANGQIRVIGN